MAKSMKFYIFLLRLLAFCATLSAAIVMVTSHETTIVLNLSFEAKFDNTPAFVFFVIANAIGSVYTLVLLFPPTKSMLGLITVALDLIITMLLTSSISATLAIAYIGKKGNSHAGWLPICNETPKFCNHVSGALLAGCVGVILHMILLLQSIHSVLNPLLL